MIVKRLLMIGAQGMLGRPVARRLIQDGFAVRALARVPDAARALLPLQVEVVLGDLQNISSIDSALDDCQAVYVSVDTQPGARFHAESEGLRNVVAAARNHPGIRLMSLSAIGICQPECATHTWRHLREKHDAEQIAMNSGLSWTIWEPSWFMESLPAFVRGKQLMLFSGTRVDSWWIAGDDFGRMISKALSAGVGQGEIIPVQGQEKLSIEEAARRFIQAYNPMLHLLHLPFWLLQGIGLVNGRTRDLVQLFNVYEVFEEPPPDQSIWERIARPTMNIEDYAGYVHGTGDFPHK